jgi:hypothetical protein
MIALVSIKPTDLTKGTIEQPYRLIKKILDGWKGGAPPPHIVEYNETEKKVYVLGATRYSCTCSDNDWTDFVKNFGPLPSKS